MPRKAKYLCWIDIETTGLDHILDPILEVGGIITGAAHPFGEIDNFTYVIMPSNSNWISRMNTFVKNMHTKNGLLVDIEEAGEPIEVVERKIINRLSKIGRPHDFMLSGSGVSHFDRRFIQEQMPGFDKWLQHPSLDVGTLRRAISFCNRNDLSAFGTTFKGPDKPHRGLNDVFDHLAEWRRYASLISAIPKEN